MGYLYIFLTILFTVYGQIILKWRITDLNWSLNVNEGGMQMLISYLKFLFDPLVFSGFASAFIASVFWMLAMTKFDITYAYPFMSLSPPLCPVSGRHDRLHRAAGLDRGIPPPPTNGTYGTSRGDVLSVRLLPLGG